MRVDYYGFDMGILLISILALFLFRLLVYGNLEITPFEILYIEINGIPIKAVDRELTKLLDHKTDYKILNKEFKSLKKYL